MCRMTKGVDERTDESVLRWFGYIKRVYVGECVSNCFVGRPQKRVIDSVNVLFEEKIF